MDQQNILPTTASWSVTYLGPLGQEFVPSCSSIEAAELKLANMDSSQPSDADVIATVHAGDINAPALGTSLTVTLPYGFSDMAHFDFPEPVPLTPGTLYVIQIQVVSGSGNVCAAGGWTPGYAKGRLILAGQPMPSSDNSDLIFREGFHGGTRSCRGR